MKLPFVLAHTAISTYEICPKQAYHRYVAKDLPRGAPSPEMEWGIKVHEAFEQRIKRGVILPHNMEGWEKFAMPFDKLKGRVRTEMKLGIWPDGKAADFFATGVFCRGKADVVVLDQAENFNPTRAIIFDWKTGKKREDPTELELHSLMLKATFPSIEKITGQYVWLKDGQMGREYDLSHWPAVWQRLTDKATEIAYAHATNFWPPKQGPLCGWCAVKSCEFHPGGRK